MVLEGSQVELTLASPVTPGETVTLSYTKPDTDDRIQDVHGPFNNVAANFTDYPVRGVPVVSGYQINDPASGDTYQAGETIEVIVGFNDLLTVTLPGDGRKPELELTIGDTRKRAVYSSSGHRGTTTTAVYFEYSVQPGDRDADGISIPNVDIRLNGATLRTAEGTDAVLTHAGLTAPQSGHKVDGGPLRPTLSSATVNGAALTLTYNRALDTNSVPAAGAFAVTVADADAPTVSDVSVSGSAVTFTLSPAVTHGQTVTVSYTVPETAPVQDTAGNDAAAFTNRAVTNSSPDTTAPALSTDTPLAVNDMALTLTYDEALDENSVPAAGAFTVRVAGSPRGLAADNPVVISGRVVTLNLSPAVTHGQRVAVSYAVPGTNPVQDTAGNAASAFTNRAVNNITDDTTAPALSTATVRGARLTLTYDETLKSGSVPAASAFMVMVADAAATVSSVSVSGRAVTLTLSPAVTAGQTVTVSYSWPATNPIQDLAGNKAMALTDQPVRITTSGGGGGGGGSGGGGGGGGASTSRVVEPSAGTETVEVDGVEVTVTQSSGAPEGIRLTLPEDLSDELPSGEDELRITIRPASSTAPLGAALGFSLGSAAARAVVDITVTPRVSAPIVVCLPVPAALRGEAGEERLRLLRYDGSRWSEVPGSSDQGRRVCANVREFSLFALGFEAANRAPEAVGQLGPVRLVEGGEAHGLNLLAAFRDPDGDALTFTAASSNPAVASVVLEGFALTVTSGAVGTATVTVTARDPGGAERVTRSDGDGDGPSGAGGRDALDAGPGGRGRGDGDAIGPGSGGRGRELDVGALGRLGVDCDRGRSQLHAAVRRPGEPVAGAGGLPGRARGAGGGERGDGGGDDGPGGALGRARGEPRGVRPDAGVGHGAGAGVEVRVAFGDGVAAGLGRPAGAFGTVRERLGDRVAGSGLVRSERGDRGGFEGWFRGRAVPGRGDGGVVRRASERRGKDAGGFVRVVRVARRRAAGFGGRGRGSAGRSAGGELVPADGAAGGVGVRRAAGVHDLGPGRRLGLERGLGLGDRGGRPDAVGTGGSRLRERAFAVRGAGVGGARGDGLRERDGAQRRGGDGAGVGAAVRAVRDGAGTERVGSRGAGLRSGEGLGRGVERAVERPFAADRCGGAAAGAGADGFGGLVAEGGRFPDGAGHEGVGAPDGGGGGFAAGAGDAVGERGVGERRVGDPSERGVRGAV